MTHSIRTLMIFTAMLCLLVSPAVAKTLSFPASSSFGGKNVTLTGEFKSAGTQRPTVILLHGCGGLRGAVRSSLRAHASALNSAGFSTLILDSFGPRNISGGWVCSTIRRLSDARSYRQKDVRDAVRLLVTENLSDPTNIFIMGQSNGGSVVSLLANNTFMGLRAVVAYYPWCGVVSAKPKVPLLVLSGEEDDWTPPAKCVAKDKPGGNLEVVTYTDAKHSFDLNLAVQTYKGHTIGGNPKARSDARRRMINWFKANLR